ncbi:hypothetical protein D9757_004046 [Collybiopsis confluens]|uniref:RING-type domain-containing protein n=1 Tax=Collybiopsis confluens TaxID=2823264 RepID=A0A8H5HWZ2_9AGAR|nr:hypothetical protein D9757_004046 [Collybiopsis confluens]
MPLIIHPSSTCDVCLDPYAWDDDSGSKEPFAIPCGHLYCLSCLESLQSECCPLCRKRFMRDSIKKLHMDPPPNSDENAMVQKLIMAWDDEVEVVGVLEEIERWLERTESLSLRQLKKMQSDYQRMKVRKSDDKWRIRKLESSINHLQRSNVYDRDVGLAMEASYSTTIEELENMLSQAQSETHTLRNQIARLEFNNPRRDKGKGRAPETNFAPENDTLQRNPLPAPPITIPMERYATLAGDVRSSSTEAEQVAAAVEASIHDRRSRDGYSSDFGPSSLGAGPSGHTHTRTNGVHTNGHVPLGFGAISYPQHFAQSGPAFPPPVPAPTSKPRRAEALPVVLDVAVSQAQLYALRSSPSRRNKIVPGATDDEKVYVAPPPSAHPGSQTTYVNEYVKLPALSSAPVDDTYRRRHREKRHKSKSRSHRREELPERGEGREGITGVTSLGLIDESLEERRRNDPQTAFVSGYMEGLNNGFEYGATRGNAAPPSAPTSAPLPRARPNGAIPGSIPQAPVTTNESSGPRPPSSRRNANQNVSVEVLADRLHGLMEDPSSARLQATVATDNRTSTASTEVATWGTVTTLSSRRQSNASDVMPNLRSFPAHGHQPIRTSTSSEIPVGDPRAFLPVHPPSATETDGRNEAIGTAIVDPSSTGPLNSLTSASAIVYSQPSSAGVIYPTNSETPVASASSRSAHRRTDHQSASVSHTRPANHRLNSVPVNMGNVTNTSDGNTTRLTRHSRDNRPQRLEAVSFPAGTTAPTSKVNSSSANHHIQGYVQVPYLNGLGTSAYHNKSNPLPILPNFGFDPASQGSAPPRPPLQEVDSAPAVPYASHTSNLSRASNHHHQSYNGHSHSVAPPVLAPEHDINALGLELGDEEDDDRNGYGYGHDSIPAFAAPTPRASHGLFLRSFSYDATEGETLYR